MLRQAQHERNLLIYNIPFALSLSKCGVFRGSLLEIAFTHANVQPTSNHPWHWIPAFPAGMTIRFPSCNSIALWADPPFRRSDRWKACLAQIGEKPESRSIPANLCPQSPVSVVVGFAWLVSISFNLDIPLNSVFLALETIPIGLRCKASRQTPINTRIVQRSQPIYPVLLNSLPFGCSFSMEAFGNRLKA